MATNVHSVGEIGKIFAYLGAIVVFVVVALTWVPDWISPEGTNGTGNREGVTGAGVGATSRMIN